MRSSSNRQRPISYSTKKPSRETVQWSVPQTHGWHLPHLQSLSRYFLLLVLTTALGYVEIRNILNIESINFTADCCSGYFTLSASFLVCQFQPVNSVKCVSRTAWRTTWDVTLLLIQIRLSLKLGMSRGVERVHGASVHDQ